MSNVSVSPDREIYQHSPIVEAVIDIRLVNRPNLTINDLDLFAEKLSVPFGDVSRAIEVTEEMRTDGSRSKTERPVGLLLRHSTDARQVLQIQLEGFSFSHLAPYERWERFRDEAQEWWNQYAAVAEPQLVRRVGVRYINRLEVGGTVIDDLTPFVNVHPVTPWQLTSPPSGFSLQLRVPLDRGANILLNEATVRNPKTREMAILVDLDAFTETEMSPSDDVWNVVEGLHVEIEKAFEAVITDRVRERIR